MFISFTLLVAWNFKVGFDFLKADLNLFAVLNFLVVLLFFITLGSSIKSRKKAMEAYQVYLGNTGKSQRRAINQTETRL
jgi:ABC-type Na+ efflux pump permease subunit